MIPLVVVTAVIGEQTDPLQDPTVGARTVPYICFSHRPQPTAVWSVQPIVARQRDEPAWRARETKIRLHHFMPDVAVSVWIDAAFQLRVDPRVFLSLLGDRDVLVFPHPDRQTVSQEASELQRLAIVPDDRVVRQARQYLSDGLPPQTRLASTGLLVRRHTDRVSAFCDRWWQELVTWQHPRDQMSVNYAAWQSGVQLGWLTGHYRSNTYARWTKTKLPCGCPPPAARRATARRTVVSTSVPAASIVERRRPQALIPRVRDPRGRGRW